MIRTGAKVVTIESEPDIVIVRRSVRELATTLGFGTVDSTRIVTAASELARNIFKYAGKGTMSLRTIDEDARNGIELTFVDKGPGIADIDKAMEEGFTTSGGLGKGLPGAKKLMDEMELRSTPGKGTTIVVRKWHKK